MTTNPSKESSAYIDNGSKGKPPRFDPEHFSLWKGRMLLFLRAQNNQLIKILNEGPYVPRILIERNPTAPGSEQEEDTPRSIVKPQSQWSEEDKTLVDIDAQLQSFIVMSLPNDVYHSIINCTNGKEMWDTLCTMYEGLDHVIENKRIFLNRQYELFMASESETLTQTYNRFNCLMNDMKAAGVNKEPLDVMNKFMDSLPSSWEYSIDILRDTGLVKKHELEIIVWYLFKQGTKSCSKNKL